jgi:hypothetical protein
MDIACISLNDSDYRSMSLLKLITLITDNEDPRALEEIHTRRIFHNKESSHLRVIEYLEILRERAANMNWRNVNPYEIADEAHDITLEKFSNMLQPDEKVKQSGSNCRLYYRALRKRLEKDLAMNPPKGALEEELRVMQAFQGLVNRHFLFSIREAERKCNLLWSRYCWHINGFKINLWMPKSLSGNERRKWLTDTIGSPDSSKLDERKRIQGIINGYFADHKIIPLKEESKLSTFHGPRNGPEFGQPPVRTLVKVVAEEKAFYIEKQRPGIKKLGAIKLKKLIMQIFNEIRDGCYRDANIAKKYGLSKSTFSRFAGSRWRDSKSNSIPDLWMNTAKVLATHSAFKELSIRSGVWDQVKATLDGILPESPSNE